MGQDPTAEDAVPRAEPVRDVARPVDRSGTLVRIADYAEETIDRLMTGRAAQKDGVRLDVEKPTLIEAPVRPATRRRSGKDIEASPLLALPRVKNPRAVALFVHGGDVTSRIPARRADPAYLRIVPFARDLERRSHGRIGGAVLRLAMRGWNDPDLPALGDTQWALRMLRQQYPDLPVALVGHSMGGRVVLHLGDEAQASAIVALAPWAADAYHAESLTKTPLLVLHGRRDSTTDPRASADLVQRIKDAGGDATFVEMAGAHAMIRNADAWHKQTSGFLLQRLEPHDTAHH